MAVTDLKAQFCKQLKKYIKNAGVKQCELASALKMSASAVSQMLSGLIVPNVKQLDIIMEKIALDRVTCAVLRDYLIRIRSGEEDLRSPLNDFIRDSRIKAGLSIEELSEQSGIPVEDLNNLENMLAMQPMPSEAARLAAVFNCDISELWQDVPELNMTQPYPNGGTSQYSQNVLHENTNRYAANSRKNRVPIVDFAALKFYRNQVDRFVDFAWRHMKGCESSTRQGMVIVNARGSDLGMSDLYTVNLRVVEMNGWLAGALLLCKSEDKYVLAVAGEDENSITAWGSKKRINCSVALLVSEFSFDSAIFAEMFGESDAQEFEEDSRENDFQKTYPAYNQEDRV
ncbi:MAG: helix-turn-helix domain-containing protein [Lentisphaerae bacterium]|nr:helix-turn-helix domain-containing protein [Lentisphaerota bacterium]